MTLSPRRAARSMARKAAEKARARLGSGRRGLQERRAVVHLGMPKTGTTSIQDWMKLNDTALQARGVASTWAKMPGQDFRAGHVEMGFCMCHGAGVLMPYVANRAGFGVTDMEDQADFVARYTEHYAEVLAATEAEVVLISNEDFSSIARDPALAVSLDTWLAQFFERRHYVLYLRRQEEFLPSLYSETIRGGLSHGLAAFLKRTPRRDYNEIIAPWAEGVGREQLTVRLFERDALVGGDLFADFAEAAGIDIDGMPRPPRVNEALSVPALAFLRKLNQREARYIGDPPMRNPISGELQWFLADLLREERRLTLSPAQLRAIREANAECNERVRAAWFPDRAELFPAKPRTRKEGSNQATAEELAMIGVEVYRAMRLGELEPMSPAQIDRYRAALAQTEAYNAQAHSLAEAEG